MEGVPTDKELRGIIPNAFQQVFDHVALKGSDETYLVRASYFEIYNEEIRDLLSSTPKASLELKESIDSGVYVKNLTSKVVKSFSEIDRVMQLGKKNRSVGATLMNLGSSRSHSVFTIVIECCSKDQAGEEHIRVGKLNLVDLAGSERQGKTGATGERLKEATKINLSLSALGNVISALVDGKTQHVPYRDSKLTRILQVSLFVFSKYHTYFFYERHAFIDSTLWYGCKRILWVVIQKQLCAQMLVQLNITTTRQYLHYGTQTEQRT